MESLVTSPGSRPRRERGDGRAPAARDPSIYDVAVVGGGIVGLSTARALTDDHPGARVVVLEKEEGVARHQSGRNSGVVHSGVYYVPGSLKARYAVTGRREIYEYCGERGIPHRRCGKVIVAADEQEVPRLRDLEERGTANGLDLEWVRGAELRELEPGVDGVAALHVPCAGITDYGRVARSLARELGERGTEVRLGAPVERLEPGSGSVRIGTPGGDVEAGMVVNCAGLHSDRIARRLGAEPGVRIVPFRGEYFDVVEERRDLVRRLVYPVPDPDLPFLGVHLTPSVDGGLHAGPNAVLALSREGYRWSDVNGTDLWDTVSYHGFWRLAARHWRSGLREMMRSGSRRRFARSLRRLVPGVEARDLVPARAGVRAQAVSPDGRLVDDFLIVDGERSVHVCNAPSPAATSSFPIGRAVAERVAARIGLASRPAVERTG